MADNILDVCDKNIQIQKFVKSTENAEAFYISNEKCYIERQDNIVNNYNSYKRDNIPTTSVIFQVPNPVKTFRGRKIELENVGTLLRQNHTVVISGMAGIGKTELAKHFTNNNRENFLENLIWINAQKRENLINSFSSLSQMLQISTNQHIHTIVQLIYSHFKDSVVLFVFDNAENRESLRDFLPSIVAHKNIPIFVLITSQNNSWGDDIPTVPLDILPVNDSIQIFQALLGTRYQEKDKNHWLELANFLNNIPLALQIVGADINEEMKSYESVSKYFDVGKYITTFCEQKEDILINKKFPDNTDNDYTATIYAAVENNLQRIIKMETEESEIAMDILYLASYLDASSIRYNLFSKLERINNNENILVCSVSILFKYSLMSSRKDFDLTGNFFPMVNIHRLVQSVLRYRQEYKQIEHNYYTIAIDFVLFHHIDESHTILIFYYGEQQYVDICVNYYLSKKDNEYLKLLNKHSCNTILLKIFKSMFRWQAKKLILSQNLIEIAVATAHVTTIKLLLQYAPYDIHQRHYSSKWTLLHIAANNAQVDKVKLLLDLKADVNVEDKYKLNPLHILFGARWVSCRVKEDDVLECAKLLVSSTNLHALDIYHFKPAVYTAIWVFPKVLQFLLEDCQLHYDVYGLNQLLFTLVKKPTENEEKFNKFKEFGSLLLKHGARVNIIFDGKLILHTAVFINDIDIIKWLVSECNVNINLLSKNGSNVLHKLAKVNSFNSIEKYFGEIFQYLVENGADLNWKNNKGLSPIDKIQQGKNKFLLDYLT